MKKLLLLLSLFLALHMSATSDSTKYEIHIIEYSYSWTSAMHYHFDNELKIEEVDNVDKNVVEVFTHRQLFGKEEDAIRKYLSLFMTIELNERYESAVPGQRNQKRITIKYGDDEKSFFVSNTYQQDIAALISFLNSIIPEPRRMQEFVDPNKPVEKK